MRDCEIGIAPSAMLFQGIDSCDAYDICTYIGIEEG
jgi:hypothetical protein